MLFPSCVTLSHAHELLAFVVVLVTPSIIPRSCWRISTCFAPTKVACNLSASGRKGGCGGESRIWDPKRGARVALTPTFWGALALCSNTQKRGSLLQIESHHPRTRSANYRPLARTGLLPLLERKVLPEHGILVTLRIVYGCFPATNY